MNTLENRAEGYNAQLRQHAELIRQTAERYFDPGSKQIKWAKAFLDNPVLANDLLVGDGTQNEKIKRLSNVWRYMQKKAGLAPARTRPEGTRSALLDQHRQQLEALSREFTASDGSVRWQKALAANPELAKAIGYADTTGKERKRFLALLGFWLRDRVRGGRVVDPKLSATMKRLYAQGGKAGHVQRTGQPKPWQRGRKQVGPFVSKLPETAAATIPVTGEPPANGSFPAQFCPCCGGPVRMVALTKEASHAS